MYKQKSMDVRKNVCKVVVELLLVLDYGNEHGY